MKTEDKNNLKEAFAILSEYRDEFNTAISKSVLVVFDGDSGESWQEVFETKEDFFERFIDDEHDCEGFSWSLWENGQYNRVSGEGRHYHLIKMFEV